MVSNSFAYPLLVNSISYKETDKSYSKKSNRLDFYKWYCVVYGSVEMVVDGKEVVIGPEESLLIPPKAIRRVRALKTMVGYICLYFENRGLDLKNIERKVIGVPEPLLEDFHDLTRELKSPGSADSLHYVYSLLIRLIIAQARQTVVQSGGRRRDSFLNHDYRKEFVRKVDQFIFSHICEPLTRKQIASSFSLSSSHLARVYRRTAGVTLVGKIVELRMEKARRLLLGSTMSITHIAAEVGYNSYSHFTQVFKKEIGVTPSIYRMTQGNVYRKQVVGR